MKLEIDILKWLFVFGVAFKASGVFTCEWVWIFGPVIVDLSGWAGYCVYHILREARS